MEPASRDEQHRLGPGTAGPAAAATRIGARHRGGPPILPPD